MRRGDAFGFADQRGTGTTEGTFALFSRAEREDCYDTIEWIAARPWSNTFHRADGAITADRTLNWRQ